MKHANNSNSNNSLHSLYFLRSNYLKSFWIIKTFMVLVIYDDLVTIKRSTNTTFNVLAVVSENLTPNPTQTQFVPVTSRAAINDNDGNDVLEINNFKTNFSTRNQLISDTLQHKMFTSNSDLLSAMENYTHTNDYTCQTCTTTPNSCCGQSDNIVAATQPFDKVIKVMTTADTITTTITPLSSPSLFSLSSGTTSLSSSLPSSEILLQQRLLFRPKRYLSFPEGSSFSVAVCITVGIIGNPKYNYMSFGLNWGVAYDLPNTTWILNHLHGFAKRPIPIATWHRRSRRALYKEIENVVDNMGYNGRDCVLRALCESRQYFKETKMSMIGEMLRTIFSLPKQRIYSRELAENNDIKLYDHAYRKARSVEDCSKRYDCGFSLLELAFGKYSSPPPGYYEQH